MTRELLNPDKIGRSGHTRENYKVFNGDFWQEGLIPNAEESKKFWGDIWGLGKEHKAYAEWLIDIKNEKKHTL